MISSYIYQQLLFTYFKLKLSLISNSLSLEEKSLRTLDFY